jgi:hypothetical protein
VRAVSANGKRAPIGPDGAFLFVFDGRRPANPPRVQFDQAPH